MKYLLKQAIMPILNLLFCITIGLAIFTIDEKMLWLEILLCVLNMLFFGLVSCVAAFKDGEKAYKVLLQNDLQRKIIIQTGEDLPVNRAEEYKAWKGFAYGAIASIPTVVLVAIHYLLQWFGQDPTNLFGVIGGVYAIVVFGLFMVKGDLNSVAGGYVWALLLLPYVSIVIGVAYILGAKKVERQQKQIKQTHLKLHGEKD